MSDPMGKRVDIISDTHGRLSPELMGAIDGCDLLIHAGDITSEADFAELEASVPLIKAVLGNNDSYYEYGKDVGRLGIFVYEGLRFSVAHYREDLPLGSSDVAVCGHTHVAKMETLGKCLVVNPGSASYPRGKRGPTMARLYVEDGVILSAGIVDL